MVDYHYQYHKYLLKESFLGYLYRRIFLFPLIRIITGSEFLEVGCGLGIMLSYGNKRSVGIDINKHNIEYLKEKGMKGFLIPDSGIFPLKNESFNVILCDQVLEHIDNPHFFLNEINRCLKANGRLIIGVPQEKGFKRDKDHKAFYNIEKLKELLENHKFNYKFHFYLPLPFSFFGKLIKQQSLYVIFRK